MADPDIFVWIIRCFFCGREIADRDSRIPVLLIGNLSYDKGTLKWAEGMMSVPRCKKCKLLHDEAVSKVGWRWLVRHVSVLMLVCVPLALWLSRQGAPVFAVVFLVALPALLIVPMVVEATFNRERTMRKLLNSAKPPDAYLTFPPLAERLHGDWKAYVSPYCMYGNWYPFYQAQRGFDVLSSPPSLSEHCYPVDESQLMRLFLGKKFNWSLNYQGIVQMVAMKARALGVSSIDRVEVSSLPNENPPS